MIKFCCKNCGQKISVPEIHAGKKGKCTKCKSILVIPKIENAEHTSNHHYTQNDSSKEPSHESKNIIKFECTQCRKKMEAPDSLIGQKLACSACGHERKVPKCSPKPRAATVKQKDFARKLGIKFDEAVTFDEISEKITAVMETRYFVMDVWKEITGMKLFECGISDLEITRFVDILMTNINLSKEILIFREWQYEEACEKSNEAGEKYYSHGGSELLDFKEYLPSVRECKVFSEVSVILQREWSKYMPKAGSPFWKRLFN